MSRDSLGRVLDEALRRLGSRYKQDLVLLHGSYAKGTFIDGASDVDLLIVSDDFDGIPVGDRLSTLAELLSGIEKPVEAIAYTKREFVGNMRQFNLLVLDAMEYGKPILRTEFFEVALREFEALKEKHGLKAVGKGWKWSSSAGTPEGHGNKRKPCRLA